MPEALVMDLTLDIRVVVGFAAAGIGLVLGSLAGWMARGRAEAVVRADVVRIENLIRAALVAPIPPDPLDGAKTAVHQRRSSEAKTRTISLSSLKRLAGGSGSDEGVDDEMG
jgi:hypothetical protein